MATKIEKGIAKRLEALNIVVKTEEEAREAILKALKKEGLEGVDDESLVDLLEMLESFAPEPEEEVDSDPDYVDEDDEDDEEEPPAKPVKPVKEVKAKSAKPAKVVEVDDEDDEEEPPAKPVKSAKPAKVVKEVKAKKIDLEEVFTPIKKIFKGSPVEFNLISSGMSVKFIGENGSRVLIKFFKTKETEKDIITTVVVKALSFEVAKKYFKTQKIEYYRKYASFVIPLNEIKEVFTPEIIGVLLSTVKASDAKLGKNREELEEKVKGKVAKVVDPLAKLTRSELKAMILERELEVKVYKSDTDEVVREKVRAAINAQVLDTVEEEEEEEDPTPVKKGKK